MTGSEVSEKYIVTRGPGRSKNLTRGPGRSKMVMFGKIFLIVTQ